jgi:hypothetical protein
MTLSATPHSAAFPGVLRLLAATKKSVSPE